MSCEFNKAHFEVKHGGKEKLQVDMNSYPDLELSWLCWEGRIK